MSIIGCESSGFHTLFTKAVYSKGVAESMVEQPILQMKDIRKTFGNVVALNNVSLSLNRKEVHGLLGGNGAGKTTLMNVLYGLYKPDAGDILLDGEKIQIRSPKDAISHKIGMVHQHFLQVDSFSVVENIVLGTPLANNPRLDLAPARKKIGQLAEHFGLEVETEARIEDLSMGIRQRVEILKALYRGVKILILDEPTTNLTPQEVDHLFHSLRAMVNAGMSVAFITHKLREVLSVCDRITVLRQGETVFTLGRSEADEETFVQAMVGEEMDVGDSLIFSRQRGDESQPAPAAAEPQPPTLRVQDVCVLNEAGLPAVDGCTFTAHQGEILGIAGVAGNGQLELAESIMGIRPLAAGEIIINDTPVSTAKTVDLLQDLVTYIPEDRLQDGYLPTATVAQNLILGFHRKPTYNRHGFLKRRAILQASAELISEYNIITQGPNDAAANLSGGNIQRVMIARALSYPSQLLLAHNPTRGLDIPSMEFVYRKLLARKESGQATLLISEDLDELLLMCDRIATLYRGKLVGLLKRADFDKYQIGRMMSGVTNGK